MQHFPLAPLKGILLMDIRDRLKVTAKKMQQFLFVGMDSSYGFGILGSHDSGLVVCGIRPRPRPRS